MIAREETRAASAQVRIVFDQTVLTLSLPRDATFGALAERLRSSRLKRYGAPRRINLLLAKYRQAAAPSPSAAAIH